MAAAVQLPPPHIYDDSTRLGLRQTSREPTKTSPSSHYRRTRSPPTYTERRSNNSIEERKSSNFEDPRQSPRKSNYATDSPRRSTYNTASDSPRRSSTNYTSDDPRRSSSDAIVQEAMLAQQQQPAVVSYSNGTSSHSNRNSPERANGASRDSSNRYHRSSSSTVPATANTAANYQTRESRDRPLPPSPPRTSQPPSYSGPPAPAQANDSAMYDASGQYPTRRAARRDARAARRASGADGPLPPPGPNDYDSGSPHISSSSHHSVPPQTRAGPPITSYEEAVSGDRRPPIMSTATHQRLAAGSVDMSANSIDRLGSPSVTKMVLEPLETKMREYQVLIDESQHEITDLDERLRILNEERRKAEERYVEVKAKYDEYEKRHLHVNKALKGEFQQMQERLQAQQAQAAQQRELQFQQQQQQPPQGPLNSSNHSQPQALDHQTPTWTMQQRRSVDSFDSQRSDNTNRTKTKSKFFSLFKS